MRDGHAGSHPMQPMEGLLRLSLLDGELGDAAWQEAEPFTAFTQRDPVEGAAPIQRSEVRIPSTDEAPYMGARLWDSPPDSIISRLARRDAQVTSDRCRVSLGPYHDKRTGFFY